MPNRQDADHGADKAANQNVKGASFGGIHEILHQNDVNLARVPVFNVRYVTLQQRCGEAPMEHPRTLAQRDALAGAWP